MGATACRCRVIPATAVPVDGARTYHSTVGFRRSDRGRVAVVVAVTGVVLALAAGAIAFTVTKRGSATNSSIFTADFANRTYSRCSDAPVKLTDGVWTGQPTDAAGVPDHVLLLGVHYGDVTNDDKADAVVSIVCESGASGSDQWFFVFQHDGHAIQEIGAFEGDNAVPGSLLGLKGSTIRASVDVFADTDAHCCPSSRDEMTLSWTGSKFIESARVKKPNPNSTP